MDKDSSDRAASLIELGFDHDALGGAFIVGFEILHVGHEKHHFEKLLDALMFECGNRYADGIAAPFFGNQVVVGKVLFDGFDIGTGFIDLIDGNDDGNTGSLGVVNGFDCLRHDTVVGRHHENCDIGGHGTSGTHGGEGFVARRI